MHLRPIDRLAILSAAFVALTILVWTGATDALDTAVLELVLPLRTPVMDDAFSVTTAIGGPLVSSVAAIVLTLALVAREGRRGRVVLLMFAGIALEVVLKQFVFQPGPPSELVRDSVLLSTLRDLSPYTYPGGHVMRVAFLSAVLVTRFQRLGVPLAIVTAVVAFGRVYLAAGWFADVVGGLLAGLALATLAEVIAARVAATRPAARVGVVTP